MDLNHISKIPMQVEFLLNRLRDNGYEAYAVGGCVRDTLMGIAPHDWDICTSALPDKVAEVFSNCTVVETGIKHGTVTVILPSDICDSEYKMFEITTYRIDGVYKDNRHPESVEYTSDLTLDLARRDFTINAIAFGTDGIIDPFGGKEDIENRVLRCVGNPDDRFKEDALRIIRAVRFAIRFGFRIENETFNAMKRNAILLKNISKERVCDEMTKILSAGFGGGICSNDTLNAVKFFIEIIESLSVSKIGINHDMLVSNLLDAKGSLILRLALLFRNTDVTTSLKHFKFSNDVVFAVSKTVYYGNRIKEVLPEIEADRKDLRHIARKLLCEIKNQDAETICAFANITTERNKYRKKMNIDRLKHQIDMCKYEHDVYSLQYLAVDGNDLIAEGYVGKEIGIILTQLLDMVMYDKIKNKKEDLLFAAKTIQLE